MAVGPHTFGKMLEKDVVFLQERCFTENHHTVTGDIIIAEGASKAVRRESDINLIGGNIEFEEGVVVSVLDALFDAGGEIVCCRGETCRFRMELGNETHWF